MSGATLTETERLALNDFVAERWSEFTEVASRYLDDEEVENLGDKLQGQ